MWMPDKMFNCEFCFQNSIDLALSFAVVRGQASYEHVCQYIEITRIVKLQNPHSLLWDVWGYQNGWTFLKSSKQPFIFVQFGLFFSTQFYFILIVWDNLGMVQEDLAISPCGLYESYFLLLVLVVNFVKLQKIYINISAQYGLQVRYVLLITSCYSK